MSSSTDSSSGSSSSKSYKIFRRLPPFYTLQPNLQSQSKQITSWIDFILDVATAAFHQTGALGIQVTPHSALFKSPKEVNRVLTSGGARTVLRALVENEAGNRCLPLALEDSSPHLDDEGGGGDNNNENANPIDDDFEDLGGGSGNNNNNNNNSSPSSSSSANHRFIFANCDALVVFALPCEQIVKSIWEWHDELQTSSVFSITEVAEEQNIKKRIAKKVIALFGNNVALSSPSSPSALDVSIALLGEMIVCDNQNNNNNNNSNTNNSSSMLHVTPLSAEIVIETIMTADHPAMSHIKRPSLLSGASGSLGLKFG